MVYKKIIFLMLSFLIFNLSFPHAIFAQDTFVLATANIEEHTPEFSGTPEENIPVERPVAPSPPPLPKKKPSGWWKYVLGVLVIAGAGAALSGGDSGGGSGGDSGTIDITW